MSAFLIPAALTAARQWTFEPAREGSQKRTRRDHLEIQVHCLSRGVKRLVFGKTGVPEDLLRNFRRFLRQKMISLGSILRGRLCDS